MPGTKVASLFQLAEEELAAARKLAGDLPRQASYQVAQAAEKAARAICEHEAIPVGTTHNLGQIAALLPRGHALQAEIEALNFLSSASTKYRYPDPSGRLPAAPSAAELSDRIARVDAFIRAAKAFVNRRPLRTPD